MASKNEQVDFDIVIIKNNQSWVMSYLPTRVGVRRPRGAVWGGGIKRRRWWRGEQRGMLWDRSECARTSLTRSKGNTDPGLPRYLGTNAKH